MRRLTFTLGLALLVALPLPAFSRKRSHGNSPRAEITAVARGETAPQRIVHRNGRTFEELDVQILSAKRAPEGDAAKEESLVFDTRHRVHVVHDLTCGGKWVDAKPGDRLEIKGEYVHPPSGADLIHFTHPADGSCPGPGGHPGGYLRLARAAAALPSETPDLFRTTVRPVLAKNCMCHEKGEKMYAKLPFDNPDVLSSHTAGVRKRLKAENLATFERWLATLPSTTPEVPTSEAVSPKW